MHPHFAIHNPFDVSSLSWIIKLKVGGNITICISSQTVNPPCRISQGVILTIAISTKRMQLRHHFYTSSISSWWNPWEVMVAHCQCSLQLKVPIRQSMKDSHETYEITNCRFTLQCVIMVVLNFVCNLMDMQKHLCTLLEIIQIATESGFWFCWATLEQKTQGAWNSNPPHGEDCVGDWWYCTKVPPSRCRERKRLGSNFKLL